MKPTTDPIATAREGIFDFTADDAIYADHFPGRPVVPGSLIIHAFISVAMAGGWRVKTLVVKQFRFIRFVTPGRYRYRIHCPENADGALTCELFDADTPVTTGKLAPCN